MKIPKDVVEAMREAISPLDTEDARERYRSGNFPRANTVKNLDERYRWDLLWASRFDVTELYDQFSANSTHIDTALRSIVKPL